MRVPIPFDPRLTPLVALRRIIPLPGDDAEDRDERRVLHRQDIREAVK